MAAADRPDEVREAVQHEDPREEEMPRARHRQPAVVGNRDPPRKARAAYARRRGPSTTPSTPVVSNSRPNTRVTPCMPPLGRHARADLEHRRRARVRRLAPVERRMRVEDVEPAHQQDRQRDDVDPVHDAHRQRVAVVEVAAGDATVSAAAWRTAWQVAIGRGMSSATARLRSRRRAASLRSAAASPRRRP